VSSGVADSRVAAIEGADLRNQMIPCGDCEESEMSDDRQHDDIKRDIRRIDTELDNHERETDRAITELATHYKHISSTLDAQGQILTHIDKRIGKMEVDLGRYNNMRERLDIVERTQSALATAYVPRDEFNGAVGSVRQFADVRSTGTEGKLRMLVWGVGVFITLASGTIGFVASAVFGG
jgi:chromosome segregation ATPase